MEGVARMVTRACFCICLIASGTAAVRPASPLHSAHSKIALIEYDRARPGAVITLDGVELAAYANEQAGIIAPGAVRGLTLTLTPGHAEATAYINFLKVRQAGGESDNWLVQQLLDGERKVTIRVKFSSQPKQERVDVERVEVEDVFVQGNTLDFLLRQFVIPSFPDAQVNRWFALGHNIERLDVKSGEATVVIAR